jgi:hypothetical protein
MRFGKVGGVVDAEWDYRGLCWSYTIRIKENINQGGSLMSRDGIGGIVGGS